MYEKTLTDLYIERGLLEPIPQFYVLDGDGSSCCTLDGEEKDQNEKKSQT